MTPDQAVQAETTQTMVTGPHGTGLLHRGPTGWDLHTAERVYQSIDLATHQIADDEPPPIIDVRSGDRIRLGTGEKRNL